MGVSKMVEDGAEGSLVWVQRRNGTWWPGRVVGPTEISTASHHQLLSASSSSSSSWSTFKTPVMLLGKDYHSVDWYNLEKSKRIKAFRCGEFDDCIKKAESSSQASSFAENLKYARRRDAILHALALEKKEQLSKLKRTGELQGETVRRAKRSRCTYLPVQSQSSKVSTSRVESDNSTFVSGAVMENTATAETELHTSEHEHRDADGGRGVQDLGHSQRQLRSMKIHMQDELGESSKPSNFHQIDGVGTKKEMQSCRRKYSNSNLWANPTNGKRPVIKNIRIKIKSPLAMDANCQEIGCASETKSRENSKQDVSQSALRGSNSHDSDDNSFGSAYSMQQNEMEMLIDVDLTVQKDYRGEHVPFICLVSRTSGKAVIGHPIDIEGLHDSSETFLPRKNSISKSLFEDDRSRIHQLVWKTSRRTPVCYIPNSPSCATPKNGKSALSSQNFSDSKAKGNGCSLTVKSAEKSMRKSTFLKGKTLLANATTHKGSGNGRHGVTCVPVKQVFSKIFEAVGKF